MLLHCPEAVWRSAEKASLLILLFLLLRLLIVEGTVEDRGEPLHILQGSQLLSCDDGIGAQTGVAAIAALRADAGLSSVSDWIIYASQWGHPQRIGAPPD